MYETLIKRQAEEIGRLRAAMGDGASANDEMRRIRSELVKAARELEMWRDFVTRLRVPKRARREIEEFLIEMR